MSLKKLILVLLLANLGYFAYNSGWLEFATGTQSSQREPGRIKKQINPDAVTVTPLEQIPSASLAPVVLSAALPTTAANDCPAAGIVHAPEQWLIYMGPYANKDELERKKSELAKLGIKPEEVSKSSLKPGLSLAQFSSEAQARTGLLTFNKKGVKTATVILWSPAAVKPVKNGC